MLSAISQFETELWAERQMDGMAKERGVRFGQQKPLTAEQAAELQARPKGEELIRELMAGDGLSKATVYRQLN
jgi:DNA invertase Pin-like site-specific DNA recombinase